MCGLNVSSLHYKTQRPSQILQSEDLVSQIVTVLQNEYINPFDISIDKSNLLNLSSGVPIPSEITHEIFALPLKGKTLAQDFIRKRIITNDIPFNNPIKKNINKNILEIKFSAKVMICRGGKEKVIAVNGDILARLLNET